MMSDLNCCFFPFERYFTFTDFTTSSKDMVFWNWAALLIFSKISKKLTSDILETDDRIIEKWGLAAETNMYAKFH